MRKTLNQWFFPPTRFMQVLLDCTCYFPLHNDPILPFVISFYHVLLLFLFKELWHQEKNIYLSDKTIFTLKKFRVSSLLDAAAKWSQKQKWWYCSSRRWSLRKPNKLYLLLTGIVSDWPGVGHWSQTDDDKNIIFTNDDVVEDNELVWRPNGFTYPSHPPDSQPEKFGSTTHTFTSITDWHQSVHGGKRRKLNPPIWKTFSRFYPTEQNRH